MKPLKRPSQWQHLRSESSSDANSNVLPPPPLGTGDLSPRRDSVDINQGRMTRIHHSDDDLFPPSDQDSHITKDTEYPEFYDSAFGYSEVNESETVYTDSSRCDRSGQYAKASKNKRRSRSVQNGRSHSSDSSASTTIFQSFRKKRPSLSRLYKPPQQSQEKYQYTVVQTSDLESSKSVSFASKVSIYDEPGSSPERVALKGGPAGRSTSVSGGSGAPLIIPKTTVSEAKCEKCKVGYMKFHFSFCALCLAVCCFPCGIICCLMMRDYKCTRCKCTARNITLPDEEAPITLQPRRSQ